MAKNKKIKAANRKQQRGVEQTDVNPKSQASVQTEKRKEVSGFQIKGSLKTDLMIFFGLAIVTVLLYSLDLHLGFFSVDDPGYVVDNPWIKDLNGKNLAHILTQPYFSNYSPIHILSYLFDYTVAGPDPYFFHLSSNIWAGIVSGFVYLVAFALLRNRIMALAAAVLFIFHPSHVEAIAWISSRKDIIAAAFVLPCFLAYLQYRKGGASAKWWYISSLVLFLFAVGGKLSVATFPAVLFAYDLFVEKRSFVRSLVDKIPFLAIGVLFALAVASAQPATGNKADPFVFMVSLEQSLWLLTGFGSYVLNRVPATPSSMILEIVAVIVLLAIFLLPLLLRKRWPLAVTLFYWILFTYLPSQVLSFVHPVTDRYLYTPSVAVVILVVWAIFSAAKKIKRNSFVVASFATLVIAIIWGMGTINYLNEWRDPRSVWYAAVKKSSDPDTYYSLGASYLTLSGELGPTPRGSLSAKEKEKLATEVWKDDPRLPKLQAEWNEGKSGGPMENELRSTLWKLAEDAFDTTINRKETRAMPHLYLRLGVLALDRGNLEEAKKQFLAAIDEVSRYTVIDVGHELTVVSYSDLGLVANKQGNFREALQWYKLGEEKQKEFGGNWVADMSDQRKKMETMVALQSGEQSTSIDPNAAFNLGMYYLNSSNKLATAPIDESKQLANEVWKNNPQLPALLAEWNAGQHGGPTEKIFQGTLRQLAWNAFEKAVENKGTTINSNLYFRRGMILGEGGDMNGARKEFTAALNEAAKEPNEGVRKEVTVTSEDALGILGWREKNYKDALGWFQKALQHQNEFGGKWVPDLNSKIQQMQSLIASPK